MTDDLKKLREFDASHKGKATYSSAVVTALLDRLEAAEKDAARLDFIQANAEGRLLRKYKKRWSFEPVCSNYEYPVFQNLRDALDYAMGEQT